MAKRVEPEGGYRTELEKDARQRLTKLFTESPTPMETRLDNFSKYIRRQSVTRFLSLYELFKQVLDVKGSIIECGVYHGFGLMSWAHFSAVFEPVNLTRRIYGFDTFEGFPKISDQDKGRLGQPSVGALGAGVYDELSSLIKVYDDNRFLGHVPKVELVKGDAKESIPEFITKNPHLIVSLLFLDFDLYEPTKTAIQYFMPRMPKGAIIAFDELDNPLWPGETKAVMESVGINNLEIRRVQFDPYIGYAIIN